MSVYRTPGATRGPVGIIVDDGYEADVSHAAMIAASKSTASTDVAPLRAKNADNAVTLDGERLIDLPAVLRRVPVARSTLFERIREGSFPKGRKFGRRRLWRQSDVDAFVRDL